MESFGLRILVVDNDPASRQTLSAHIRQAGHEAIEAWDGQDGHLKAIDLRPDVVIAQHAQPMLSGVDLVRKIKSAPEEYRPYIILAAKPEDRKALQDQDLGIDDIIDTPLCMEIVSTQLRAAQRIARLQQENERYLRELHQYSEELTCSNLRLRELAITDDLTGLPNRRYSIELMQHDWAFASKDDAPLSCMVIDLDGLKQINDEQGLERGDVVLKTIAAIMRKYLPSEDSVCRISGDEFLVICPGAQLGSAVACGEKLVSLVKSFNIHAEDYPLSLSIGVAERRPGVEGPQELINLAEQAMHHAKRVGKNQVCSGHAPELRVVRKSSNAHQPAGSSRRKAKKQFSLWRTSDVLEIIAANA